LAHHAATVILYRSEIIPELCSLNNSHIRMSELVTEPSYPSGFRSKTVYEPLDSRYPSEPTLCRICLFDLGKRNRIDQHQVPRTQLNRSESRHPSDSEACRRVSGPCTATPRARTGPLIRLPKVRQLHSLNISCITVPLAMRWLNRQSNVHGQKRKCSESRQGE
jgi:hypothetical protein